MLVALVIAGLNPDALVQARLKPCGLSLSRVGAKHHIMGSSHGMDNL
jgi:hypothetical protein